MLWNSDANVRRKLVLKKLSVVIAVLALLTGTVMAYGPEKTYDPNMADIKVYRGYIINHSPDNYLIVYILKKEDRTQVYGFQVPPKRPANMPYKKWGKDYIPDLKSFQDLLEHYVQKYGEALWIRNIVLREGDYIIRHKWSHLPETAWKESEFNLMSVVADTMGGPYLIEFYEE
jgi:hypothetical protein